MSGRLEKNAGWKGGGKRRKGEWKIEINTRWEGERERECVSECGKEKVISNFNVIYYYYSLLFVRAVHVQVYKRRFQTTM